MASSINVKSRNAKTVLCMAGFIDVSYSTIRKSRWTLGMDTRLLLRHFTVDGRDSNIILKLGGNIY